MIPTPTTATGRIREATRRQPTTMTPRRISHDCQAARVGVFATLGV